MLDFHKYECYNLPHVTTCPGLPNQVGTRYWRLHRRCSGDAWLPFRFSDLGEGKAPRCDWYTLHYSLPSTDCKTMPDELKSVLNDVITTTSNYCLFADLSKESDSDFETILLHSHMRWFSKKKVLKRYL